jgi:cobalt-zinc-cadmium efflux system protein
VGAYLQELPGISAVHDLHIWGMSTTSCALTAHLVKPDGQLDNELLTRACDELHAKFGIEHVTIQLESNAHPNPCSVGEQAPAACSQR